MPISGHERAETEPEEALTVTEYIQSTQHVDPPAKTDEIDVQTEEPESAARSTILAITAEELDALETSRSRTKTLAASPPTIPRIYSPIQLKSPNFSRNWSALLLTLLASTISVLVCVYWTEVLPARIHSMMFEDPSKTIFTVAILSAAMVLILDKLVALTCDNLRWSWCAEKDGISALEFAALGNISTVGLVLLLFSCGTNKQSRGLFRGIEDASFRFWACVRLFRVVPKVDLLAFLSWC